MVVPFETALVCPLLLGREPYLVVLDRLIARACGGQGQVALITGEAGIGKSRLVAEVQAHAAQHGLAQLRGRCFEPDRLLPLPHYSICSAGGWPPAPQTTSRRCWDLATPGLRENWESDKRLHYLYKLRTAEQV